MEQKLIYGIQQIGVGVDDAAKGFEWYATRLGSDVRVFDDNNTATYMAPYMGGEPREKRAILAVNMQGGSGYEIWQHTGRKPEAQKTKFQYGDLGINVAFVKTRDVHASYKRLKAMGEQILTEIGREPDGKKCFYLHDPYNNILKVKEFDSWYATNGPDTGGTYGCALGVSDIEASRKLFSDIIGYDTVIYDREGTFADLKGVPGGKARLRRVLLGHSATRTGGFSRLFGESQLELVQLLDAKANPIFANRYWGDIGFIHLCFDIKNMKALTEECAAAGFPFTVLSNDDFDMGDANGHWGYLEDPDGTLIEFVETHKVPIVKQIGLSINLKNRDPKKPLPNWLVKAMALKRVRFKK